MNIIRNAIAVPIFMQILLYGCVTTEQSLYSSQSAENSALEQRLTLARRYIGDNNWENAKRNLKLAAEISPKDPEVYEVYALFHQSTREFNLAEYYFKEAIRLKPDFSRARNNYAAYLYAHTRYKEAESQLVMVISDALYSARPQAFVNLGMCRLKLADKHGAKEAFEKALLMDSDNVLALVELGYIALATRDLIRARKYFDMQSRLVKQQSSRALWLGIQIARNQNDRDLEDSLYLTLQAFYPNSTEYQLSNSSEH